MAKNFPNWERTEIPNKTYMKKMNNKEKIMKVVRKKRH